MSEEQSAAPKRTRGRPKSDHKSQVIDQLLDAAESLLRQHGKLDQTERAIAAEAGVSQTMIPYYFGGKDGLLFAVIDRFAAEITDKFSALYSNVGLGLQNPTRHIVKTLIDSYYAKPWIARLMISEMTQDDSVMKELFVKRYGPRPLMEVKRVLDRLVELGVYDEKNDMRLFAMSLFSIITAPLSLTQLSEGIDLGLDDLRKDIWIDHVADLFDSQLRKDR